MPLTHKGNVIRSAMEKQYGAKKGEEVFYASRNKGTISGVDSYMDAVKRGDSEAITNSGRELTKDHGRK